jgi:tRNA-dihydrouridine synthase B
VARSTSLPMTCKIRSGWNEEMRDPVTIALRCQDAGARVLALHPRTRTQMYSGHAHWDEIAAVVDALDIPVLGNGDIRTPQDAFRMRQETGCAGVMIARGSFGQPWIFDQTRDLLEGRPMRADPPVEDRFAVALDHARMANDYEPDRRGAAIEFRKHLGWYVKGLPGSAELRKKLHAVTSLGEVEGIFDEYLQMRDRYLTDDSADAEPLETIEV